MHDHVDARSDVFIGAGYVQAFNSASMPPDLQCATEVEAEALPASHPTSGMLPAAQQFAKANHDPFLTITVSYYCR
jgi:hypothetical protein